MNELRETSESKDVIPNEAQLDMEKIQASMQGIKEQQEKDLQEDIAKFDNRLKPAYFNAESTVEKGKSELKKEVSSQPQSEDDALINEINQLRKQREEELQEDLEKFKNRSKPPYYKE